MVALPKWIEKEIVDDCRSRNIIELFEWQGEVLSDCCLREPIFSNLLYAAPTSSGKTIVAEFLALNNVMKTGRKAIFIFPYISVAREKFLFLQKQWRNVNLRVRSYMGNCSAPLDTWDAAVCTIEKANSLLNKAIDEDFISEIGVVVVDEFHMLFDVNRGQLIENIVSKFLYLAKRKVCNTQILGMSATVPNVDELAEWMDAKCYKTEFRPIDLDEMILADNELRNLQTNRLVRHVAEVTSSESERIVQLCLESLRSAESVLIFCSSKAETERIATVLWERLNRSSDCQVDYFSDQQKLILTQLIDYFKKEAHSVDEVLLKTLSAGVSFHHAGLTMEERELIEDFFKVGVLKILCATTTLSSGVNLPAHRVIIKSQLNGPSALTNITYCQMVGRAGRYGQSSKGRLLIDFSFTYSLVLPLTLWLFRNV